MDRDGTINEEVGYLKSLDQLSIFSSTFEAIRMINESGMKAVVITNQSGVARGFFDELFVDNVHEMINTLLKKKGSFIDRFYYCPHHPTEGQGKYRVECDCRKPKTGMLIRASEELGIDLSRSYMVGDMQKDLKAAANAGVKGILVRTGYGNDVSDTEGIACVAENILDAVKWIMKDMEQ